MAVSSPSPTNQSPDTPTPNPTPTPTPTASTISGSTTTIAATIAAITNGATAPQRDPPKNLRGLNKPKCSKCGNVARSRCPYQSCKSCCAKAQNPCHIHVLKANATFSDKTPSSSSPLFDQQSTDVSPAGASMRVSSLRQLSQFSGAQIPPRARRPLTRKDAATINQWRFSKLKEYKDGNTEAENEAFDRYMHNVSLLEEAFSVNSSLKDVTPDEPPTTSINGEEKTRRMILDLKTKLRSNPRTVESFRWRMQGIVDRGMKKLENWQFNEEQGPTDANDLDGLKELKRPKKTKNLRAEKTSAVSELIDKLNKARSEDDLQSCLQIKSKLFNRHVRVCPSNNNVQEQILGDMSTRRHGTDYLLPKLCSTVEVNQEILHTIDTHFSSLEQIEDL